MSRADLPVAILAGGLATRLGPLAADRPKLLVEVAGEPFFHHQLRLLRQSGMTQVVLCVGHLGEQIRDRYGDGAAWGVELRYSFDGARLLGTGGALIQALPQLGERFLVLYGDSYLPVDFGAVAGHFLRSARAGLMTVFENRGQFDRSNVQFEAGEIVRYDKARPTPAMQHIDYGLGAFHARAFDGWPRDAFVDLADVQRTLAERGELAGLAMPERFYEIGSPTGLNALDAWLRSRQKAGLPSPSCPTPPST